MKGKKNTLRRIDNTNDKKVNKKLSRRSNKTLLWGGINSDSNSNSYVDSSDDDDSDADTIDTDSVGETDHDDPIEESLLQFRIHMTHTQIEYFIKAIHKFINLLMKIRMYVIEKFHINLPNMYSINSIDTSERILEVFDYNIDVMKKTLNRMIDKSYLDDDLRQRSINLGKMFKKLTGFFRINKEIDFEDLSRYSDSIMHDIGNYIEKDPGITFYNESRKRFVDMMNILPSILSSFKSLKDMCNVLQSECEAIKIEMKQINKRKRKFNSHNGPYNYIQPSITKIHKQPLHPIVYPPIRSPYHSPPESPLESPSFDENEVDDESNGYNEDHWFY